MENKEFSKKLEARTKTFAIRIIKLSATLPNIVEGKIVRNQLTKAGTSIGANYREANRARSRADFKNKIKRLIPISLYLNCYTFLILRK